MYRTYLSDKIENLVLKENSDGTFSGFLIQYNITKEDRNQYYAGQNINLTSGMKVHNIDGLDINISAKVQTDIVGCLEITWETGTCTSELHHPYGDTTCQLTGNNAAPEPRVISIKDICDQQQTGGEPGPGTPPGPGDYGTPGESYNTFPFVSIGYEYYATEDLSDPNYVHYQKTNQYFQTLPGAIQGLNLNNPDLFYYTYFYFKDNGVSPVTKAFVTDRLTKLNNWYIAANNNPDVPQAYNQILLNWAFKYLMIDHPEMTWEEFYNQFLVTPCEKIKLTTNNTTFKSNITSLEGMTNNTSERGYRMDYQNQTPTTPTGTGSGNQFLQNAPKSTVIDFTYFLPSTHAIMHTHYNTLNDPMFSPGDIIQFNDWLVKAKAWNNNPANTIKIDLSKLTYTLVTSLGNYTLMFDGTDVVPFTNYDLNDLNKKYIDKVIEPSVTVDNISGDVHFNMNKLEEKFLQFVKVNLNMQGMKLFKVETDGNTEIFLKSNNSRDTKSCN